MFRHIEALRGAFSPGKQRRGKWVTALIIALLLIPTALMPSGAAEVFFAEPPEAWASKTVLEWTIFDVNEGDAMLLSCGGESMMVDGGPKPFREALRDALEKRGLHHMKYILNTHFHDDHIDGLYYLFTYGFTADAYLHSYSERSIARNARATRTVNAAKKNGVAVRRIGSGHMLRLGEANIYVYQCPTISNVNARSLMVKVVFGDSTALLCADITGQAQQYFLEQLPQDALKADIIKMPHHAITPAVPEFLDAVMPEVAIATNRIDRIGSKSLNQLSQRALTTLFSGEGTVYAVTDGTDWYLYQTPDEF